MTFRFVDAEKANYPTTMLCRLLGVSTSGFYEWLVRKRHPSPRTKADAELTDKIKQIHTASRQTYGAPRIHAELALGEGIRIGRKRVARLMKRAGLQGVYVRRRRGCTRRNPDASPAADLVARCFVADAPDVLWVSDVTEHMTEEGKVYLAVVLDAWSRRVVGWSIADHIRAELVVDALQMAIWRRRPGGATIVHSDQGSQYTSWAFGRRLRSAGLLGSTGSIGDALDNAMAESFFHTLQLELLDRRRWATRKELTVAIFDYIEAFYNPKRRHSSIGNLSPIDFEARRSPDVDAA